jgi:hypothetical protein
MSLVGPDRDAGPPLTSAGLASQHDPRTVGSLEEELRLPQAAAVGERSEGIDRQARAGAGVR